MDTSRSCMHAIHCPFKMNNHVGLVQSLGGEYPAPLMTFNSWLLSLFHPRGMFVPFAKLVDMFMSLLDRESNVTVFSSFIDTDMVTYLLSSRLQCRPKSVSFMVGLDWFKHGLVIVAFVLSSTDLKAIVVQENYSVPTLYALACSQ